MIVRSPRPRERFVILDNAAVRNPTLSYKARGLLAYLLSLPDNWQVSADQLARHSPDGRHSVLSGLAELEQANYLHRVRLRMANGQFRTVTVVYDTPTTVDGVVYNHGPESGFPTSGNRTPIEEPTKNEQMGFITDGTHVEMLTVCGQCSGTGTAVTPTGELDRCGCELVSRR